MLVESTSSSKMMTKRQWMSPCQKALHLYRSLRSDAGTSATSSKRSSCHGCWKLSGFVQRRWSMDMSTARHSKISCQNAELASATMRSASWLMSSVTGCGEGNALERLRDSSCSSSGSSMLITSLMLDQHSRTHLRQEGHTAASRKWLRGWDKL